MPLEVTPLPFANNQLPYAPKFVPEYAGGPPGGSFASIANGPASAAASAIIPPVPGAIASPNMAIPALPEAGYTAPTIRPIGGSNYGESHGLQYGAPGSVMAGGSLYEMDHSPRRSPPHVLSVAQSNSLDPSSLPAPRHGPPVMRLERESVIAPKAHHAHHQHHKSHRSPSRPHDHGSPHHSPSRYDNDDAKSDASYYAIPKAGRYRSGSMSSWRSQESSPREPMRPRSGSLGPHHHPQIRAHLNQGSPSSSVSHSPVSPSPLSLAKGPNDYSKHHSPKSPISHLRHESLADDGKRLQRVSMRDERPPNQRRHSSVAPEAGRPKPPSPGVNGHKHQSKDRTLDKENVRESQRLRASKTGNPEDGECDHYIRHQRRTSDEHLSPSAWDDSLLERPPRHGQSYSHDGSSNHQHHHHAHPYPGPHIPPPQAVSQYGASPQGPGPQYLLPDASVSRVQYRRRASSMDFGGHKHPPPPSVYQTPSMGGLAGVDAYDDGASMAGSAMTFMDGSVGGRTSQYGLPKYPHQPKPDYRRFCVQRGTANVFLD